MPITHKLSADAIAAVSSAVAMMESTAQRFDLHANVQLTPNSTGPKPQP